MEEKDGGGGAGGWDDDDGSCSDEEDRAGRPWLDHDNPYAWGNKRALAELSPTHRLIYARDLRTYDASLAARRHGHPPPKRRRVESPAPPAPLDDEASLLAAAADAMIDEPPLLSFSPSPSPSPQLPASSLPLRFRRAATSQPLSASQPLRHSVPAGAIVPIGYIHEVAAGGGGGGGGGGPETDDEDGSAIGGSAGREIARPLEDPMAQATMLRSRWLYSGRNHTQLFAEFFDTNLENALLPINITHVRAMFQKFLDELFECESALARDDYLAENDHIGVWRQLGRANAIDGDIQEDFDTIRQLLHALLIMGEQAYVFHAISQGSKCSSLGRSNKDIIRSFRSRRGTLPFLGKAISFFMDLAYGRNFRKLKREGSARDDYILYEPRIIDGFKTVSFNEFGTIKDWMFSCVQQDLFPDVFAIMLSKASTMASVQKYLEDTTDSRLPPYVVSEGVHGFENGYFLAKTNQAFFYEDSPADSCKYVSAHHHDNCKLLREWFEPPKPPPAPRRYTDLQSNPDGSKYWTFQQTHHDGSEQTIRLNVPANCDVENPPPLWIDMPAMQQILHFQEFTGEMMLWLYALMGRMLLAVGTLDDFAVIVLFSGATQSGKSTLLEAFLDALFPNKSRIAVLGSNTEVVFGLQTSYNKDCLVCDEMEKKPSWSPGDIKSMATGGYMSIARKHRDQVFMRWRAPTLLSSNYKVPQWVGDVFALVRRFAPFPFPHTVANPDHDLKTALVQEACARFVVCIQCYHWVLANVGRSAFNKIGPLECQERIKEMLVELHPLVAFLECGDMFVHALVGCSEEERRATYMPMAVFKEMFDQYVKTHHVKNDAAWNAEFYTAPLARKACTVGPRRERLTYPRVGGQTVHDVFIYGLDVAR